jgi:8-oxo-dGTP pyrophosphatase MutT (NUDIX family)
MDRDRGARRGLSASRDDEAALLAHPTLRRLRAALGARPPVLAADDGSPRRAAVAIVLRQNPEGVLELLLIKRSEREDDPWSGHIALPGGRHDPSDATLQDTAVRETREETGVDIDVDGLVLGMLDELRPRTPSLPPIIVTPFVAVVRPDVAIATSDEVAAAFWVGLHSLADPAVTVESEVTVRGATWRVPSYVIDGRIVWGMTERILNNLLDVLNAVT